MVAEGNSQKNTVYAPMADMTLRDCWHASLAANSEKTAVIDAQGMALSYAEVDLLAARIARYLADCGINTLDVVSCQLPGWVEFLPIYVACLKLGAVINPIPPNLRYNELKHILSACNSKVLFVPRRFRKMQYCELAVRLRKVVDSLRVVIAVDKKGEGAVLPTFRDMVEEDVATPMSQAESDAVVFAGQITPDSLAALVFTSGSEGQPKGVMLSHRNIIFAETSFASFFQIDAADTMFMPAPVAHATGFHHGVSMPFIMGATSVLLDVFNAAKALELIKIHRCTVTMAATPFLYDIVQTIQLGGEYDFSSLRFFLCGGSPPNVPLSQTAEQIGLRVLNVYGSTESVPHMGTPLTPISDHMHSLALCPMPGIRVRVVDRQGRDVPEGEEGEEISYSPAVFMGYLREPELTAKVLQADGWVHSGDLCRRNADGTYSITGRLKDIIVRGGENISSLAVENVLLQHPKVKDAAVVGMPDERLQERICAYVVLHDKAETLTFQDVFDFFLTQDIAKQKFPEHLEILDEMPRTASGKVRKTLLRQWIAEKLCSGSVA
ncbi:Medium-chain fatty-acid--CoA ligase [bioreactor metagenome]|uniref:Medium-chain fatty-acid--CoA ligase n=1 Tax=bioreactor metagenome TaxID=1076179 RepID=A0A644SUA9_9ZZZZ|nr:AMP-binding protein [Desulfovibrio desulfuricans]MEA4989745.1 AMP-binding protein [Desulfovibrio desulfuricans]